MPQKRNPISSELMVACAKLLRERCSLMLDAMMQDFERATGPWQVEWSALPEAFLLVAASLTHAQSAGSGLRVDVQRMRENLELTRGMVMAEGVMMALAPTMGRPEAHRVVSAACRQATASGAALTSELERDPAIAAVLSPA